ncbi:MAG: fumarylacetoacetate hydrolase family protein, partial [Armatimonadota bacterium]
AVVSGYDDASGTLKIDNYTTKGEVDSVSYDRFRADWKRHANLMWVAHPQKDARLDGLRAAGRLSREAEIAEGLSISDIWVNERLEIFIETAYRYRGTKDDLVLRLNGEVKQQANTREMIFNVAEVVSYISHICTLQTGDVIACGTPAGVGKHQGIRLADGDVMEVEIPPVGVLRTPVVGP